MSDTEQLKTLSDMVVGSFKRVETEIVVFAKARVYLMATELVARGGLQPLKKYYDRLVEGELSLQYETPYRYFIAHLFISLVASFELYIKEIVGAVVFVHPKKIGKVQLQLSEIVDSDDKSDLIQRAIDKKLDEITRKRPREYLREITSLLSIDEKPLLPLWSLFIEAKARRDLGVHNGWKCNATYRRKVAEVGVNCNLRDGELMYPNDEYADFIGVELEALGRLIVDSVFEKHIKGWKKES